MQKSGPVDPQPASFWVGSMSYAWLLRRKSLDQSLCFLILTCPCHPQPPQADKPTQSSSPELFLINLLQYGRWEENKGLWGAKKTISAILLFQSGLIPRTQQAPSPHLPPNLCVPCPRGPSSSLMNTTKSLGKAWVLPSSS